MEGNVRIAPHAIASVEEGFFPVIYASKNDEGYSQKSIRLKTPKLSSVVILSYPGYRLHVSEPVFNRKDAREHVRAYRKTFDLSMFFTSKSIERMY